MSFARNTRNVNRQLLNRDSEKSDLEESHILEERLKDLLSANKREFHRAKNIFNDFQGDVPKLRGSVITRALQKVVCSTPMPTEKQRDFFLSETSFNISPIDPISEENLQGNNEQPINVKDSAEGKEKEIFNKEAKVVLTRTSIPTVVILDSSSETEKDNTRHKSVENKSNGTEKKICYNTRSQNKNDSIKQANATVNQDRENKSANNDTTNSKSKAKISQRPSRKDSLSDRKRIDKKSPSTIDTKSPSSEDQIKVDQSSSKPKKGTSRTKSLSQSEKNKLESTKSNTNKMKSSRNEEAITEPVNNGVSLNGSGKGINYSRSTNQTKKDKKIQQNSYCAKSPLGIRNSRSRIEGMDQSKSPHASKGEKVSDNPVPEQILLPKDNLKDSQNKLESEMIKSLIDEIYDRKNQSQLKTRTPTTRSSDRINSVLHSLKSQSLVSHREIESEENRVNTTKDRQGIPDMEKSNLNSDKALKNSRKEDSMIENNLIQYSILGARKSKVDSIKSDMNKTKSPSQEKNKETTIESLSPNRNYSKSISHTKEDVNRENANCIFKSPMRTRYGTRRSETTDHIKSSNTSKRGNNTEETVSEQIVPTNNSLQNNQNKLKPTNQVSPLKMKTPTKSKRIHSLLNSLGSKSPGSCGEIETQVNTTRPRQSIPLMEKDKFNTGPSPRRRTDVGLRMEPKSVVNKIVENARRIDFVDAGTSPLEITPQNHLGYTKDCRLLDSEKIEKLNMLLTKMSRKFFDSPHTPIENDKRSTRLNHREIENSAQSQLAPCLKKVSCNKINREIQTSVRRPARKISPKRSFAKSIFTRTVIEQQTQTTSSVDKTLKTYRRDVPAYISDSSRNSSATDQSEVLKELEMEREDNMLFQSLTDGILLPTFSSSDDEVVHSINQENLPWRLDDDVISVPRRSSYKLNFLRSAQEIEMERKSAINSRRTCDFSDSDSEVEGKSLEKKRHSIRKKQVATQGYTKKKVYSRPNQGKNESNTLKLISKEPFTDEERSSSRNSIDNIPLSEPEIENCQDPVKEHRTPPSSANKVVAKSCNDNAELETTLTVKNVNEHNKSYESDDSLQDRVTNFISKSSSPLLRNSYLATPVANDIDKGKNEGKKVSTRGKKNGKIDFGGKNSSDDAVEKLDDDTEVLAVPLEDSDGPVIHQEGIVTRRSSLRKSKSQELGKIDDPKLDNIKESNKKAPKVERPKRSNVDVSSVTKPLEEPQFKIPKPPGRKSKKQSHIMDENDDAVSSTTTDSCESGLRRSGRERKAPPRRAYGVLATYSEKMLQYYNGRNEKPATDVTINKSTKPRTKRKGSTKKNLTMKEKEKSEIKNTKQPRRKKQDDHEEQKEPEVIETVDTTPFVDINRNDTDTDHVSVNEVQPCGDNDTSKTRRWKKRNNNTISSTTTPASSNGTQEEVPNKRNRKSKPSKNSELSTSSTKNININRVSSSTSSYDVCSTYLDIDNNHVPGVDVNTNTNDTNSDCRNNNDHHNGNTSQTTCDNRNTNDNFMCPSSGYQETTCNLEEHTQNGQSVDKDSGRSTMLKSTTFDDSLLRVSKNLTGRIGKKYKKKEDNFCTKISKVLSRSIDNSKELELLNGNDPNFTESESRQDDKTLRRSSLTRTTAGDRIPLLFNSEIVSFKYVDEVVKYRVKRDNLMVTDSLKNGNGTMGHLKLLPGCQKPLHIARKFNLFYFVIEGEGFIQVHNKTSRIGKLSKFVIPLGVEYSINNLSKEDCLVLGFVKVPPSTESHSVKTIV